MFIRSMGRIFRAGGIERFGGQRRVNLDQSTESDTGVEGCQSQSHMK